MAVGANACVDVAADVWGGVEPFIAYVAEVASFGVVAVVAAKRLLSGRVVEPGFDCAVGRWIGLGLRAAYYGLLSVNMRVLVVVPFIRLLLRAISPEAKMSHEPVR